MQSATWPCSTWLSTASFAAAISSGFEYATSRTGAQILPRAMVIQRKTQRPVQFELTEPTRVAVSAWLEKSQLRSDEFLFPSRLARSPHVSTRQYARIVHHWVEAVGLDSSAYGT